MSEAKFRKLVAAGLMVLLGAGAAPAGSASVVGREVAAGEAGREEAAQLHFLLGEWKVTAKSIQPDQSLTETNATVWIEPLFDGLYHGVRETWRSDEAPDKTLHTTDHVYVPEDGLWLTRSSAGYPAVAWPALVRLLGGAGDMRFAASDQTDQTGDHLQRGRIWQEAPDQWNWRLERTYDEGTQWFATQVAEATRIGSGTEPVTMRAAPAGPTVDTLVTGFRGSRGLAADPDGNVYIGGDFGLDDESGPAILRVSPTGEVEILAEGLRPAGLAWSGGKLYVHAHDVEPGRIVTVDPDGTVTEVGRAAGDSVGVDPQGNVYTTHGDSDAIYRMGPDGEETWFAESPGIRGTLAMAYDDARGMLYAATWSGEIRSIDSAGDVRIVTVMPRIAGNGVAWMTFANDALYVTGFSANQVFRVTRAGEVSLVAGSGVPGLSDGPAYRARFDSPNGIAASPDGKRLYIAELGPQHLGVWRFNRLRVIELQR